jgi:hypothetical protein
VEHGLHVQSQEEEHREEAGRRHQLCRVGDGHSLDPQDRQRHEWVGRPQLVDDERGQRNAGEREASDRACRAPADVRCLHERVDQQQHPAGDEERAERVEVREPGRSTLTLEQREGADESDGGEGDVHEQHPAPSRSLGQETTEEDSGGTAKTRDGRPGAEGGIPLAARAEDRRQG